MEPDDAVAQLLGVDSKLGVLAGLAFVAKKQQELQSEDEDAVSGASSPNDKREGGGGGNARKTQRKRHGLTANSGANGDNGNGSGASGSAAPANKKYSVHEQRDVIRKLQEQNQVLKQELAIESRDARAMLSHEKRQQLERLRTMAATFAKKIDLVKKNTARVDELLAKKAQELEVVRQQQHSESTSSNSSTSALGLSSASESNGGALVAATESTAASTRRVRALENRLELSLVKKNEMDSINKHLRTQIEKVQRDRVIFDGIYKKLEKELSEYRQRHELSVEELKRAMDAKHQVNFEILSIQSQAEQEQRAYEQQFQELKASIETFIREAARLGGGGAMGPVSPFASKGGNGSGGTSHSDADEPGSGLGLGLGMLGLGNAKDLPLNRISVLSTWKIGYDRALASTNESVTAKYEKAFAGIKQLTGIQDITKIAEEIVSRDENNFKRFKRVEELHQEEVLLQTQIDELTTQVEAFKAQEGIATSATQKQHFKELDAKYQRAMDKARVFDNEYEDTATAFTRIRSSVHSIHSMLAHANCARNVDKFSHGSAHLALGSHSARDVTDTNVLEYLQAIETFATSLMKETHETASVAQAATTTGDSSGGAGGSGLSEDVSLGPGSSGSPLGLILGTSSTSNSSSHHHHQYQDELLATSSPIGHGPPTLPSDPSQKLKVHVPSPGGVNGVIIIPANSPFNSDEPASDLHHPHPHDRQSSTTALHHSPTKTLQQQLHMHQGLQRRKSGGRFELMARKSLSQMQFVAALAAAVTAANNGQMPPSSHFPVHLLGEPGSIGIGGDVGGSSGSAQDPSACSGSSESSQQLSRARLEEEEEEERALTYDELRQYAAKNVVKMKSDDASLAQLLPRASSSSGSSSISSSISPSKAAAHHHQSHHHS